MKSLTGKYEHVITQMIPYEHVEGMKLNAHYYLIQHLEGDTALTIAANYEPDKHLPNNWYLA